MRTPSRLAMPERERRGRTGRRSRRLLSAVASFALALPLVATTTGTAQAAVSLTAYTNVAADQLLAGGGATFGWRAAMDGDTAVISEPYGGSAPAGYNGPTGVVHVYSKANGTWQRVQTLQPAPVAVPVGSNPNRIGWFGSSVDIDGDTLVVGATYDHSVEHGQGVVHVFERNAVSGLFDATPVAVLRASDGQANHLLGQSVAVSGDTIAAGANEAGVTGKAYVYQRDPLGNWGLPRAADPTGLTRHENESLLGSERTPGRRDGFGETIALDGDVLAVGAPRHSGSWPQGLTYVFRQLPTGWVETAVLPGGRNYDDLPQHGRGGTGLAVDGDLVVVGVPNLAQAWVFQVTATGAETVTMLQAPDSSNVFGERVAAVTRPDGQRVITVGAPGAMYPEYNNGGVFVFHEVLGADGVARWTPTSQMHASPTTRTEGVGMAGLATNGHDVIASGQWQGKAHAFEVVEPPTHAPAASPIRGQGQNATTDGFRQYDVHVGDVVPDARNLDDALILNRQGQGTSELVLLTSNGDGTFESTRYPLDATAPGQTHANGIMPQSLAYGDVTGDGIGDVVIGADADISVVEGLAGGGFGTQTRYQGTSYTQDVELVDVNADGHLDVIAVGSPRPTLLLNLGGGVLAAPVDLSDNNSAMVDVDPVDLDGDGQLEFVATTWGGYAYVFTATGSTPPFTSTRLGNHYGYRGIEAGDLDGDGNQDVVGSTISNSGMVKVHYGRGDGTFDPEVTVTRKGGQRLAFRDIEIADINGDGHLDMVGTRYGNPNQNGDHSLWLALLGSSVRGDYGVQSFGTYPMGPHGGNWLGVGDIDGDARADVVLPGGSYYNPRVSTYTAAPYDEQWTSFADTDGDGVLDRIDNCPREANPGQEDGDLDGVGDACEVDADGDGVDDLDDNCPDDTNPDQADLDGDGLGDACDDDRDGDGVDDANDAFPDDPDESADADGDGIGDNADTDDNDGPTGDLDGDTVLNQDDNCPDVANADQANNDGDAQGDACDPDDDNDGIDDQDDAFPYDPNEWADHDGDGIGDNADDDDDNDGQPDAVEEACGSDPKDAQSTSSDFDGDLQPDCLDPDDDNDGVNDIDDAFPRDPNEWADNDGDGIGDNADPDDDNDGIDDQDDNCQYVANASQSDVDEDGIGDACDPIDDRRARDLVEDAKERIDAALAAGTTSSREFTKASGELAETLEARFWRDDDRLTRFDGHFGYHEMSDALHRLERVLADPATSTATQEVALTAQDELFRASGIIVDTLWTDLATRNLTDPDDVAERDEAFEKAQRAMDKAATAYANGDVDNAVKFHHDAWKHLDKAEARTASAEQAPTSADAGADTASSDSSGEDPYESEQWLTDFLGEDLVYELLAQWTPPVVI